MKPLTKLQACVSLVLLPAIFGMAARANADVVVIVSAQNPISSLTAAQTARIFLGKTNNFPNDSAATPFDQLAGSSARNEFYSKVVRKSNAQLSAYWAKVIFTGDGRSPEKLENDAAVIKAVAGDPSAIGYVNKSAVDNSVKVVLDPMTELPGK